MTVTLMWNALWSVYLGEVVKHARGESLAKWGDYTAEYYSLRLLYISMLLSLCLPRGVHDLEVVVVGPAF